MRAADRWAKNSPSTHTIRTMGVCDTIHGRKDQRPKVGCSELPGLQEPITVEQQCKQLRILDIKFIAASNKLCVCRLSDLKYLSRHRVASRDDKRHSGGVTTVRVRHIQLQCQKSLEIGYPAFSFSDRDHEMRKAVPP